MYIELNNILNKPVISEAFNDLTYNLLNSHPAVKKISRQNELVVNSAVNFSGW